MLFWKQEFAIVTTSVFYINLNNSLYLPQSPHVFTYKNAQQF